MAQKRAYDLVVFGASGFTGRYVMEEVARTVKKENLKWAVAGRTMKKLQMSVNDATKHTGENLEELPILIADVTSPDSIRDMCVQTRLVLNCVGPYNLYGSVVVETCIEEGTHHVDISGETGWLERVYQRCHTPAKENSVYVVQACGFDSIPAEMGIIFTKQQFKGKLDFIESYLDFNAGPDGLVVNDGTWRSLVLSLSERSSLREVRKMIYPQEIPPPLREAPKRAMLHNSEVSNSLCLPFMGSDKAIVQRTTYQNYVDKAIPPISFKPYFALRGYLQLIQFFFIGVFLFIFTKFSLGVQLLTKYPALMSLGLFSSQGPTRKQVEGSAFQMTFVGKGSTPELSPSSSPTFSKDSQITTKVIGPEAGYVTTPICMVQSAYVVLKEATSIPEHGVLTPGRAFERSTLVERLRNRKIQFHVVESG